MSQNRKIYPLDFPQAATNVGASEIELSVATLSTDTREMAKRLQHIRRRAGLLSIRNIDTPAFARLLPFDRVGQNPPRLEVANAVTIGTMGYVVGGHHGTPPAGKRYRTPPIGQKITRFTLVGESPSPVGVQLSQHRRWPAMLSNRRYWLAVGGWHLSQLISATSIDRFFFKEEGIEGLGSFLSVPLQNGAGAGDRTKGLSMGRAINAAYDGPSAVASRDINEYTYDTGSLATYANELTVGGNFWGAGIGDLQAWLGGTPVTGSERAGPTFTNSLTIQRVSYSPVDSVNIGASLGSIHVGSTKVGNNTHFYFLGGGVVSGSVIAFSASTNGITRFNMSAETVNALGLTLSVASSLAAGNINSSTAGYRMGGVGSGVERPQSLVSIEKLSPFGASEAALVLGVELPTMHSVAGGTADYHAGLI